MFLLPHLSEFSYLEIKVLGGITIIYFKIKLEVIDKYMPQLDI
jgi:hypothetical protein